MTQEQNIFLAKRLIVDSIWKEANLEGISVTFPETQCIFDNHVGSDKLSVDEIVAINNLKHAWQFIIDTIDEKINFNYICEIHKKIIEGLIYDSQLVGNIRNTAVHIGGTDWIPPIPIKSVIEDELDTIQKMPDYVDKGINYLLYIMRRQMFLDGNKRVAQILANKYLISNGFGIFSIDVNKKVEFLKLLVNFYETNEPNIITNYVKNNCIKNEFINNHQQSQGLVM